MLSGINFALNKYDKKKDLFLIFSVILFFLLEALNGLYFYNYPASSYSVSFLPKLIWQILLLVYILKRWKQLAILEQWFFVFAGAVFVSGFFRLWGDWHTLLWGMKHIDKLLLVIIVYIFLKHFHPPISNSLKWFDYLLVINSLLIVLGLLFGIEYFKSYDFSNRFGYCGIFSRYSINDVSLFYLIAVFYSYYRLKQGETNTWIFILIFGASFLVGTKAIYIQNLILIAYIALFDKKLRIALIILLIGLGLILAFFYNFSFWKGMSIIEIITSNRSRLLENEIPFIHSHLSVGSLIFGMKDPMHHLVEMDFIDLFITIGLSGTVLIIFFYFRILFQNPANTFFTWVFVSTFLFVAAFAGHYFYSGMNALFLPLFFYYMHTQGKVPNFEKSVG